MNISPTLTGPLPTATGAPAEPGKSTRVISSDFQTFLKMLTVQMTNQDPLEPIKSEDYAVQLATFSGVEQQVRTNELIASMGAQLSLMGMSQMAGWVGMQARAPVPGYFDGTPIALTVTPSPTAERSDLVVRDKSGAVVQRVPIPSGADAMDWAGVSDNGTPFATGSYSFQTESFSNGALMSTTPVQVYATISEARVQNGETILVTRGGTEIPASKVTALRDPGLAI